MSIEGLRAQAAVEYNPQSMQDVINLLNDLGEAFKVKGIYSQDLAKRNSEDCEKAIAFLKTGSHRRRLPTTRRSLNHKFKIGVDKETGQPVKGYVTVGFFPDDEPGEIFISMAKTGSTVNGVLSCLAIVVSMALQHGVPLKSLCSKLTRVKFEPDGFSGEEFGFADSIVDYIFRWLEKRYVIPERKPDEPQDSIGQ